MIKALPGGGGRGMRKVIAADQSEGACEQCAAEAQRGFGDSTLFAEAVLDGARHIEVQVIGAPAGHQTHALALGDRDCSIQRRYQKLLEVASAQGQGLPAGIASDGVESIGAPARRLGIAIQARVNAETFAADGSVVPTASTLTAISPPSGPGVVARVRGSSFPAAVRNTRIALGEFGIEGVGANIAFRREVLFDDAVESGTVTTGFLDEKLPDLAAAALSHRREMRAATVELYPGEGVPRAHLSGTVVQVAPEGADYGPGSQLVILEAMKTQHVLVAPCPLRTVRSLVVPGAGADGELGLATTDLDRTRTDLDEVRGRHLLTRNEGRPAAVAKRHSRGRRSARENPADLIDAGVEYGALAVAAQRSRRAEEELIANTPADGLVASLPTAGADRFGRAASEAVVVAGLDRQAAPQPPRPTTIKKANDKKAMVNPL